MKRIKDLCENFESQLVQRVLWWKMNADFSDKIQFSEAMGELIGVTEMAVEHFLMLMPEVNRQPFLDRLACLFTEGDCKEGTPQFLLTLTLNNKIKHFQCQVHDVNLDGTQCVWAQCSNVSALVDLEMELILSQSQLALREMQEQAVQAQKSQAESEEKFLQQSIFLSMLSHELRSPLAGMSQLIQQSKSALQDKERLLSNLSLLSMTTEQLTFLVNDILTFSQNQHHRLQLTESPFALDEMLNYVIHLTKSIAKERNMVVTARNQNPNACFKGDVLRISQILINLIVNGIKYTRYGGVFVKVKVDGAFVEFKVVDSGVGISVDKIDKIFAPFSQIDSGIAQSYLGSGLGLSVVKLLVELLNGSIKVTSTRGVGSTFTVRLPLEQVDCNRVSLETTSNPSEQKKLDLQIGNKKVLIADDSLINRKVLQQMLEEFGCQVEAVENGLMAFERFQQSHFDLVFLDMQMPEMNGCEAAKSILDLIDSVDFPKVNRQIKIVALTAAHTESELQRMNITVDKSLFNAWLLKPITQDQIMTVLIDHFEQPVAPKVAEFIQPKANSGNADNFIDEIPASLKSLLPELINSLNNELELLDKAFQECDFKRMQEVAHKMKGSLMIFGWQLLLGEIKDLELEIDKKDIKGIGLKLYNVQSILLNAQENK